MKVIVAGSRTIHDYLKVANAIEESGFSTSEVVCGGATGVDTLGQQWAVQHEVSVKLMLADWNKYGKSAGPRRNEEMAKYADALVLVWDGSSRGSKNMKEQMLKLNKPIYEVKL